MTDKKDVALKLALEALEWFTAAEPGDEPPINAAITAIREALAEQPAQQQVFPACQGMNCGCTDGTSHSLECQAEHAAAIAGGAFVKPSQQEPLTDEQIDELARATFDVVQEMPDYQVNGDTWDREFARAIEAKLREKNA